MNVHTEWVRPGTWLEYSLTGSDDDPVVVFVHEMGLNLRQFDLQQQFFSKDYRVLLISLRGHGHSSERYHATRLDYTIRSFALDIQALLARLGIDKVHYVGNGLGGLAGFELLDLNPDRLRTLTVFGTAAESHISRISSWYEADKIHRLGSREYLKFWKRSMSKGKHLRKTLAQLFSMTSRTTLELTTVNTGKYDYLSVISDHDQPKLLMRCDLDRRVNRHLTSTIEVMSRKPECQIIDLHEAGHYANLEKPAAFNQALIDFLAEHREDQPVAATPDHARFDRTRQSRRMSA